MVSRLSAGLSSRSGSELTDVAAREIAAGLLAKGSPTTEDLIKVSRVVCEKHHVGALPTNSQILSCFPPEQRERFRRLLLVKPVRTASGVAVISVVTKPHPCPHGTCLYCPGGVAFGTPQSYVGTEPGVRRAAELAYDSCAQVASRVAQLAASGHRAGKAELIIIGGTFLSFPEDYQLEFVKGCFDGLNGFRAATLREAQRWNERAELRNVGLTVETRPDHCRQKHVDLMLHYGATRVELGVQALDDDVYRLVNRGHTVADVVEAFRVAKDAGLKVGVHMMPGLPGATPKQDLQGFRRLFEDADFRPDMLKIYPTLVVPGTGLYGWFKAGLYTPYDLETVVDLLVEVKRIVPRWVRIMRVQREISAHEIVGGVRRSNLRQLVLEEIVRRGFSCQCIRCREVGLRQLKGESEPADVVLRLDRYQASGGEELFLSYEDRASQSLIGFIRLRRPSSLAHRPEIAQGRAMLVRELRVYGNMVPVGMQDPDGWQHRGYGAALMAEAERISREEFSAHKIAVISAIGTREYYRKLGYRLEGPYMVKELQ